MKVIGLIGGMTWLSTVDYYRYINQEISKRLGGRHSALLVLYSVDHDEIKKIHREGRWDDAGKILGGAAKALERAGADFLVLCTNTMHKVADAIEKSSRLKLLHIADVTGEAIVNRGLKTVGLLGTRFTMGEQFYRGRLEGRFGLKVLAPEEKDIETVQRILEEEIVLNIIKESSRKTYVEIIDRLIKRGAEGVILGCTEIPLLIGAKDVDIPVFDTTALHSQAAVNMALS